MLTFLLSVIETENGKRYFAVLYEKYRDDMKKVARSLTASPEDAEEALFSAFTGIAVRIEKLSFENEVQEKAYMLTAAKNAARTIAKKQKLHTVAFEETYMRPDTDGGIDEFLNRSFAEERLAAAVAAIKRLPPILKEALTLHYLMQMSVKDMAKQAGISVSAIKARIARGKAALIEEMRKEGFDQ